MHRRGFRLSWLATHRWTVYLEFGIGKLLDGHGSVAYTSLRWRKIKELPRRYRVLKGGLKNGSE